MTAIAVRNFEKRAVRNSSHQREADDLLVELLHGIQIVDAKGDLAQPAYRRAALICRRYRHDCPVEKVCIAQEAHVPTP